MRYIITATVCSLSLLLASSGMANHIANRFVFSPQDKYVKATAKKSGLKHALLAVSSEDGDQVPGHYCKLALQHMDPILASQGVTRDCFGSSSVENVTINEYYSCVPGSTDGKSQGLVCNGQFHPIIAKPTAFPVKESQQNGDNDHTVVLPNQKTFFDASFPLMTAIKVKINNCEKRYSLTPAVGDYGITYQLTQNNSIYICEGANAKEFSEVA